MVQTIYDTIKTKGEKLKVETGKRKGSEFTVKIPINDLKTNK
ncbi:MAG TPA: hypothetical protein VLA03_09305 [Draconibacterium sp.]|nr:hypothetical protein [Draconibacterium sp.]